MAAKTTKKRLYKTVITGRVLGFCLIPTAPALALLYFSADAFKKFSPHDPFRLVFGGIPLLLALLILGSIALTMYRFNNREVVIDGDNLTYRDYKTEMTLPIKRMGFSPPGERSGPFKFIMISDNETFVHIPRLFLKTGEFEELLSLITKRRSRARQSSDSSTYSL